MWQGGVHGGGMCDRGVCMAGGMCGREDVHRQGGVHGRGDTTDTTRYGQSMRGRYASYWNAFLLVMISESMLMKTKSPGSEACYWA